MIKTVFVVAAAGALLAACGTKTQELEVRDVAKPDSSSYDSQAMSSASAYGEAWTDAQRGLVAIAGADRVFFNFDSASLSDSAQETLRKAAEFVKSNDVENITIEGHCDERGTREYNLALGDRRAVAVKKYLVGLGVSADKITTISYGKERPAQPGHDEAAWSQNRRAQLVLN